MGAQHSVCSPSYAEMAARPPPPPPNQRAGEAAHRPIAPHNSRNPEMAVPRQGRGWAPPHHGHGYGAPPPHRQGPRRGGFHGRGAQASMAAAHHPTWTPGRGTAGRGGRFPPQPRYQQRVVGHTANQERVTQVNLAVGGTSEERTSDQAHMAATDPGTAAKAMKPKHPLCFRCKLSGHVNDDCKAVLDCVVCNKKNSDVVAKCPLLKLSKPDASFFGFRNNELRFFRIPEFDYKLETPDPAPTALIKVTRGKLTAEAVQIELARFITKDWVWEALPHSDDSYLVFFPTVEELERMADVDFTLKNHGVTITISEWKDASDAAPSYQLDEVWVHVKGVPHACRHYLGFWALGSVIGVTLDVDMYTYRKMGVIRLLVGMMSRDPLPLTTNIVFGRKGYEITFTVEDENFIPAPPVIFNDDPRNDGEGGKDKEDGPDDKTPEHASKKQKKNEKEGGSSSLSGETRDGDDTLMLGTAGLPPTKPVKGPMPFTLENLPLLHKIASTPMCTHKLARSREDLKLQKNGHPAAASPPPASNKSAAAGTEATAACNRTLGKILDDQTLHRKSGAESAALPAANPPPASNKNVAAGTEGTAACNLTLGKISDDQTLNSESGVESVALPAAVHLEMNEGPGHVSPMANDLCTEEDIFGEKESQERGDVRSASHRLNDETKQGKVPILMEQDLNTPRTDEDSTLRAMKRAARRNLDGDSSGLQLADQAPQPVATPPNW